MKQIDDYRYTSEHPSKENPQSMFESKNKKIMYTPLKPPVLLTGTRGEYQITPGMVYDEVAKLIVELG